ncbi:serine protease [Massilia sp. B-10]|nr:serine protease [Massilia sp. B-10]
MLGQPDRRRPRRRIHPDHRDRQEVGGRDRDLPANPQSGRAGRGDRLRGRRRLARDHQCACGQQAAQRSGAGKIRGVHSSQGDVLDIRQASVLGVDREHDLALLRIEGAPLPALQLGEAGTAVEGQELAFTGFPLGIFLGLYPVTHHAFLSAITPVVMPSLTSNKLSAAAIVQLQRDRFRVLQLDATAYPGNSGSPVYDPRSGVVVGVINMVFVKKLKESAISDPSGISYAIPVNHVRELLQRKGTAAK